MSENENMFEHEPKAASRRRKRLAGVVGLLLVGAGLTFVSKAQGKPQAPPTTAPAT